MKKSSEAQSVPAAGAGLYVPSLQPEPLPLLAVEPSPCTEACPAGINVKSYVSLIAEGRFAEALEVVRERCPLPGICGRICHHPCEEACRRCDVDQPVAIRALKRFVADLELELPEPAPPPPVSKAARLAVVGSGPAGLTAAYDLRRAGYRVKVFEAAPEAGGMLRYGIADYRLPTDVLDTEIGHLERAGVEIETGQRVGRDQSLEELLEQGYAAVLLAVGAQKGRSLGVEGERDCSEVEDALAFLRRVNDGDHSPVSGRVLVVGGGSTAIEAARAALRLGADSVEIVYRRLRGEMPADEEEIDVAAEEGITFRYLTAPVRVVILDGKLEGLECLEVALGEEDASGRRRPVPLPGSEHHIPADRVFAAVGQRVDLDFVPADFAERVAERGLLKADPETLMTPLYGVFAAGDVVTGPSTVIDAIAAGHRAATAILEFLEGPAPEASCEQTARPVEYEIPSPPPASMDRQRPIHAEIASGDEFAEVELAFTPADAMAEARRCLRCGPCSECLLCATTCGRRHLSLWWGDEKSSMLLRAPTRLAVGLTPDDGPASGWLVTDLAAARGGVIDTSAHPALELTQARVEIDPTQCRGCARCLEVCSFDALSLVDPAASETTVTVDPALCRGCNLCAGVCPTDAVIPSAAAPGWWGTRLEELYPRLAALAPTTPPHVVLACQRRATAVEAQLREQGRLASDALLVPVRCAGQLPAGRLLEIYRHGAASVAVAGCETGSCRYGYGTHLAAREVLRAGEALATIGEEASRITGDWAGEDDQGLDLELPRVTLGHPVPPSVERLESPESGRV